MKALDSVFGKIYEEYLLTNLGVCRFPEDQLGTTATEYHM